MRARLELAFLEKRKDKGEDFKALTPKPVGKLEDVSVEKSILGHLLIGNGIRLHQ